jgi:predicted amidohydrolase
MRVAVSQFATTENTQENLASCVRMINKTAACKPSLIVLPEFCNGQPWYVDQNQAWNEALTINGNFLLTIAEQAKKHECYIVINVTIRRDSSANFSKTKQENQNQSANKANITITSCLFSPLGKLVHQADKQVLTEHEEIFFTSGDQTNTNQTSQITTVPSGNVGLLSGADILTFEASRELALGGAQLLCHSMSTFALDQSRFHGPSRASENKVFLATANKIGTLFPQEQCKIFSEQNAISQEYLVGAGQSQIISPDGKILAKMANDEEGFVFADIELAESNVSKKSVGNKFRPDGTELIKQRRPELYQKLTLPTNNKQLLEPTDKVPLTTNIAIFATYKTNEQAIEDVCHYIVNNLSDIIQLPELFFIDDKSILNDVEQLAQIGELSQQIINQVSAELRPFQYVCTSLVIDGKHQAVIINEQGLFATQQQLHFCKRYQWTTLGDQIEIFTLPLEQGAINVAMLTADDANIPEIVQVAAFDNTHLLLVPFDIQEPCEVEYNLLSRAAEHRVCIVAASREKSFPHNLSITDNKISTTNNKSKIRPYKSTGLIANLSTLTSLLPQWKPRKFDGYINPVLVKYQHGKITKALIHPISADKRSRSNHCSD